MATSKKESAAGGANIRYDAFIRNVRPDPANTEQLALMQGYVGESTSADKLRLYSDASLSSYVEIPLEDVVYSIPNEDDPLGGSMMWVRQSANLQYSDPQGYSQGNMYNEFMNNAYTPESGYGGYGEAQAAATLTAVCGPVTLVNTCRTLLANCPSLRCSIPVWRCPRPTIWELRCQISIFRPCITRNNLRTPCRPCPQTPPQTPGFPGGLVNDPYEFSGEAAYGDYGGYGDYTGGEMYNDYMNNAYTPESGYGDYGEAQAQATLTVICQPRVSLLYVCRTVQVNCASRFVICSLPVWRCPIRTIRRPCIPNDCRLQTRIPPLTPQSIAGCPSDFCTPQTPQTPQTPGLGGGGFMDDPYGAYGGGYGDYTGGEMYGDYMANEYTPAAGGAAAAAISLQVWCRTSPAICRTSPIYPPCRVTQVYNSRCCSPRITICPTRCCTLPQITPCRISIRVFCPRPTLTPACGGLQSLQCGVNPGGNFDAGYYDPYGEYGY